MEDFRLSATPFRPRRAPSRENLRAFYDEVPTIARAEQYTLDRTM